MTIELTDLPIEILNKIFIQVPELYKLITLNKKMSSVVIEIYNFYSRRFNELSNNWLNDIEPLIQQLMKNNMIEDVIFLFNNFKNSRKYINFYYGYYKSRIIYDRTDIFDDLVSINEGEKFKVLKHYIKTGRRVESLILDQIFKLGTIYNIKYLLELKEVNYEQFAFAAMLADRIDILEFFMDNYCIQWKNIINIAEELGKNNILKFIINKLFNIQDNDK